MDISQLVSNENFGFPPIQFNPDDSGSVTKLIQLFQSQLIQSKIIRYQLIQFHIIQSQIIYSQKIQSENIIQPFRGGGLHAGGKGGPKLILIKFTK